MHIHTYTLADGPLAGGPIGFRYGCLVNVQFKNIQSATAEYPRQERRVGGTGKSMKTIEYRFRNSNPLGCLSGSSVSLECSA